MPGSASAALVVRLSLDPRNPSAGEAATFRLRTFAPLVGERGELNLKPHDVGSYPFRVLASGPGHASLRFSPRRTAEGTLWRRSVTFSKPGRWTLRVLNFGPDYPRESGATLLVRVGPPVSANATTPNPTRPDSATLDAASLLLILRVALGTIFIVAAVAKLRDQRSFVAGLYRYDILPQGLVRIGAYAAIGAEVLLGTCLFVGVGLPSVLAATIGLLSVFTLVIGITLWRGRDIPCHCFGADPTERVSGGTILRGVALTALAGVAFGISLQTPDLPPGPAIAPSLVLASAIVLLVRLSAALPLAYRAFRTAPSTMPVASGRRSFRFEALNPLFKRQSRYMRETNL